MRHVDRWWLCGFVALLACSESTAVVVDELRGQDAAPPHDAAPEPVVDSGPRVPADCGGRLCACDNGIDDDGDELIDGLDPECTGPFDDDEASFRTGTSDSTLGLCQDCFWDANADSTDDGCQYNSECLFGRVPTTGEADCTDCAVSARCENSCGPRTPNGCDCFGCCDVTRNDGSVVSVLLNDACSIRDVDDATLCPRCIQHPTCRNDCGVCELCPGRKRRDLAQVCRGKPEDDTPGFSCDGGEQVCDETHPCPRDFYCQLGCCLFIPQ
jgi:hypothetical protein